MNSDRIEGVAHEAKGTVKKALGDITGDAKLKAEGVAEHAAGKVQNAAGSAADAVDDATSR